MKKTKVKHPDYSKTGDLTKKFSSPLSLGLLNSVPGARNPVEAILWHAQMLLIESGMIEPPFAPAKYAPLRGVKEIVYKDMEVDGRLIPSANGFVIELRKDRSHERKNFTCAHELGHTFFYESVPTIKYRTVTSNQSHHDEEEERLCNIAASELLLPSPIVSKIAQDYSPSPQALLEISRTFETSLTATILKLLSLKIWNSTFILWNCDPAKLEAKWIAKSSGSLLYSPNLDLVNFKTSSVYETYITGETLSNPEWISLNGGYKLGRVHSMRINSRTVLSCVINNSGNQQGLYKRSKEILPTLPFNYDCKCDGTGWYFIKMEGTNYAARCKASKHKSSLSNQE